MKKAKCKTRRITQRPGTHTIKPDKEKSVQKIDGIVAGIMAQGEWMTKQADEDDNPDNNRGMLSLRG